MVKSTALIWPEWNRVNTYQKSTSPITTAADHTWLRDGCHTEARRSSSGQDHGRVTQTASASAGTSTAGSRTTGGQPASGAPTSTSTAVSPIAHSASRALADISTAPGRRWPEFNVLDK